MISEVTRKSARGMPRDRSRAVKETSRLATGAERWTIGGWRRDAVEDEIWKFRTGFERAARYSKRRVQAPLSFSAHQ